MRKSLTAVALAATIAVAAVAAPTAAEARRGWWIGPAIGGFAAAAIIGSAFAGGRLSLCFVRWLRVQQQRRQRFAHVPPALTPKPIMKPMKSAPERCWI